MGILVGGGLAWAFGVFATRYHPIEESKLCYNALRNHPEQLHPQTREYLKARLYWNAAHWIPSSWLWGWKLDFGPVDDAALGGINPIKDASSTAEVYSDAIKKAEAAGPR